MIEIKALREYLIQREFPKLPVGLKYHNVEHTLDVASACEDIASRESLSEMEASQLMAAALLHDIGFTLSFDDHENEGAEIAAAILPKFGADEEDIRVVRGMIQATRIPQSPKTILEEYLCDADLDYLGRSDFEPIAEGLFQEMLFRQQVSSRVEWDNIQVKFLTSHQYFSDFSRTNREEKKNENLQSVIKRLGNSLD